MQANGSGRRRRRVTVLGVLAPDGKKSSPRRRACDRVHEPVLDALERVRCIDVVLEVAVDILATRRSLDLEPLIHLWRKDRG